MATKQSKHPTPTDGTTKIVPTIKPHQLELELITESGQPNPRHKPCPGILSGALAPGFIPGLDASLCRCSGCAGRATGGVWWFDSQMRHRVLKRKTGYRFTVQAGDGLRDNDVKTDF
jgi:hypothetical protein